MFLCLVLNKKSQLAYIRPLESVGWFLLLARFINTAGGMKNLPVVLFGMSISIPRTRIHKVFYPCNRCRLARLFDNQIITVTTR